MASRNYEADEFHAWVGYCITAWAGIDQRLFEIFWQILACSKNHASVIYYRINSMDTRLNLVDELVETTFPKRKSGEHKPDDLIAWNKLKTAQ